MNGMTFRAIQFSTHLGETDAARATSRFLTSLEVSAVASLAGQQSPGGVLGADFAFTRGSSP
jgi:hypothetical protein